MRMILAGARPVVLVALIATPALAQRTTDEAARVAAVTATPADFAAPEPFEALPAGAATRRGAADGRAFSMPSAHMGAERLLEFHLGDAVFGKLWVTAPSATRASDGLGPLFNARSCQTCHPGDGRGHPPADLSPAGSRLGMVLRLSVPASPDQIAAHLATIPGHRPTLPEPTYGSQLQDRAIAGLAPEGRLDITYQVFPVPLAGGEVAHLRRPTYRVGDPGQGPLARDAMFSPRVAPQMIGLGLLEAVPDADIIARADPEDADGDGISGRAAMVWSVEVQAPALGRFGHKAGVASLREMVAAAFATDLGLSNPLLPDPAGDCTAAQIACRTAPSGEDPGLRDGREVDGATLDLVTFYTRNLAVPERRAPADPQILRGKAVFNSTGCTACHNPKFVTARLPDRPEQSFQLIWPYTDLLLHDMGPGLADHRPEGTASGREWRTAPLWGIGLTEVVTGRASYLHDGRARSLLEAVLWHGGEAQPARDRVVAMPPEDRAALIRFLESL